MGVYTSVNVLSNVHSRVFAQVFGCSHRCLGVRAGVRVFAQLFGCSRSYSGVRAAVQVSAQVWIWGVASVRKSVVGHATKGLNKR